MKRVITICFASILFLLMSNASVAIINVPADYPTIQAAINAAGSGDTVQVAAGTYYEHLTIGKSLTLQGEDRDTTIIDGSASGDVVYVSAANITISGLTITNGNKGVNILSAANVRLDDCILTHHYEYCILVKSSPSAHISNCDISDAYCDSDYGKGWGLHMDGNPNSIVENVRVFECKGGRPFCLYHSSGTIVRNVESFDNSYVSSVGLFAGYGEYQIKNFHAYNNNDSGIYFNGVSNSLVVGSDLHNNGNGIIMTWYSQNNVLRNNKIHSNLVGINCGNPLVYNNEVYHNDIIDNPQQTRGDVDTQIWDNGYPSGGNFWSDYVGADEFSGPSQDVPGTDGIGDALHSMTALPFGLTAIDYYPLMRPYTIIDIDIKPDSYPNMINLGSQGLIPIAILSNVLFDATTVDPDMVELGGSGVAVRGKSNKYMAHKEDVNGDGLIDLLVQVATQNLDPGCFQEGWVTLTGCTYEGRTFTGSDEIEIVPPE